MLLARYPKTAMMTNDMNGIKKERLTAFKLPIPSPSIIKPIARGMRAPPTIANTNPADPIFASSPVPFSAMP